MCPVRHDNSLMQALRPCVVACHDDHRLAMAAAVLGCILPGIAVDNKGCVSKTYPEVSLRACFVRRRNNIAVLASAFTRLMSRYSVLAALCSFCRPAVER